MQFFLSSSCCNERGLFKNLQYLNNLNVKNIELSAPHEFLSIEEILSVLKIFPNINFITHNFFPPQKNDFVMNLSSQNEDIIINSKKLFSETIKISKFLGSKIYGFHPGYLFDAIHSKNKFIYSDKGIPYDLAEKNSITFVQNIINQYPDINFLVENLFPEIDRETSIFCTPSEIYHYLNQFSNSNIGLLLDLGHLNITATKNKVNVYEYLDTILHNHANKIKEIHLSENNGYADQHLYLENNSWQFDALKIIYNHIKKESHNENIIVCLETRNSSIEDTLGNLEYLNNAYN